MSDENMKVAISSLRLTTRMGARVLVAKLQHLQRDRVSTLKMIQLISQGDAYWSTAIPTSRQREYRWVKIGIYKFEGILWDNAISDRRNSAVRVGGGTIDRRSLSRAKIRTSFSPCLVDKKKSAWKIAALPGLLAAE